MDLTENNFQVSFFRLRDEISKQSLEKICIHEQSGSDSPLSEVFLLVINLLVLEC